MKMIGRSKKCLLLTFKRVQWKRKQHVVPCVVGLSTIRNVGFISVQNVRPSRRSSVNMFMSTTVLQEQVQELKGILIQKKRSLVAVRTVVYEHKDDLIFNKHL
ncbi:hypothetical protein Cfor_06998 [Coptotermes formosanus]|uniref:Uncharacterized protein n=1 Tax=Coptotermes formosanus TaxID=36987 RepID=A0A6L2PV48_COPFO|nr:hypothetical protein Cfor_06998 [Coptotermes formosanus]